MGIIRFAGPSDAPALLEIYRPYVEESSISFEYETPPVEEFRRRIAEIGRDYPYLVYEEGGSPLGYAYARRQMERAAYQWNAELTVYVDGQFHGRGIGSSLYGCLLALLRAQKVYRVCGVVVAGNAGSTALHRRFGFREAARFPAMGYKQGQWWDVIWYEKVLGQGALEALCPIGEISSEEILQRYQPRV